MALTNTNTRVSAVGVILNQGRILLCRLSPKVLDGAGKFTLPGGQIDFGESPETALIREVKEETGLTVANITELLDVNSEVVQVRNAEGEVRDIHAVRIIYEAEVNDSELVVESDGSTDACGWFSYEEVKQLPLTNLATVGLSFVCYHRS